MTIDEVWDVDVTGELCPQAQLPFHHDSLVQRSAFADAASIHQLILYIILDSLVKDSMRCL